MGTINREKQEAVLDLVKCMSKAEKRNFKLYAGRLAGNEESKFIALFNYLDSAQEYDEAKVLQRCPNIKKVQLPNLKAHLYKQILVSIKLLNVQHSLPMQLREQTDFARILYDKGLYRQSSKVIDKVIQQGQELEQHTIVLDAIELEKQIDSVKYHSEGEPASTFDSYKELTDAQCRNIESENQLSEVASQLFSLHLKLGYARSRKDLDMIMQYFRPRLEEFSRMTLNFTEKVHLYQAWAWYYYIRHDFLHTYQYASRWVALYDRNPLMKELTYDSYLKGYAYILDGLFYMRKYRPFVARLKKFEMECGFVGNINDNAVIISRQILYAGRMNKHFFEGSFTQGLEMIDKTERFLERFAMQIPLHNKMLLNYKMACLWFGAGNYQRCMEYLGRITETRNPQIRRDLQCYAKMLYLICSYEAGIDYNLDYQIRSVYAFLVKMNDMHQVQKELLAFLKRLGHIYQKELRGELEQLYMRLKVYENDPYERRTFLYLDILSWLEGKITGETVEQVIQRKFRDNNRKVREGGGRK